MNVAGLSRFLYQKIVEKGVKLLSNKYLFSDSGCRGAQTIVWVTLGVPKQLFEQLFGSPDVRA
jgi:hypothetical protein